MGALYTWTLRSTTGIVYKSLTVKQFSSRICGHFSIQELQQWPCSTHAPTEMHGQYFNYQTTHHISWGMWWNLPGCLPVSLGRNLGARLPDCQVNCTFLSFNFWVSKAFSPLDSLGLGDFRPCQSYTYLIEIDHCCSSSSQQPHKFCLMVTKLASYPGSLFPRPPRAWVQG